MQRLYIQQDGKPTRVKQRLADDRFHHLKLLHPFLKCLFEGVAAGHRRLQELVLSSSIPRSPTLRGFDYFPPTFHPYLDGFQ